MPLERPERLSIGEATISLPCFFPSVSSVKTNLMPVDYIELLEASAYPLWLASAYDLATCPSIQTERIAVSLKNASAKGVVVLLDSGNYEAFWKADAAWTANRFHEMVAKHSHQICFCFDNQRPPDTAELIAKEIVTGVLQDQEYACGTVLPIVHALPNTLPDAARLTAEQLYPLILAVPERALGNGILARIRTVRKIRASLDTLGFYCPLHLLGTGNPVSIAAYAMAGADSFDGLEWCQTVVDHSSAMLFHFQHFDLVRNQTKWGTDASLPFVQTALLHNLDFYRRFLGELQAAIQGGKAGELLGRYIPADRAASILGALEGAL